MAGNSRALADLTEEEKERLVETVAGMTRDGRLKVIDKVDILKVCVRASERKVAELKKSIEPDSDIVQ